MRFSVWPDQQRPWVEIAALADYAEESGWDGLYVYDHFMPNDPAGEVLDGPVMEVWTTMTAIAARTTRLRLGTLVLGNLYRHPAVVANMAASLDHISDGRLLLGLGAGWQVNEHQAYGIDLPAPGLRLDQFEEACAVISSLLREPRTTFDGDYYQLVDAPCEPKPLQERLPILIGGRGERRSIPAAARWADEWNAWTTLDTFRHKSEVLDRACLSIDRDPQAIRRSTQAVVILRSAGEVPSAVDERHQALDGTAAEVQDVLGAYAEAGLDEFIVPDDSTVPVAERIEFLETFRTEIAGALQER